MGQIVSKVKWTFSHPLDRLITAVFGTDAAAKLKLSGTDVKDLHGDWIWGTTAVVTFFFAADYPVLAPALGALLGMFSYIAWWEGHVGTGAQTILEQLIGGITACTSAVAAEFLATRLLVPYLPPMMARLLISYLAGFGAYEGYMQPAYSNPQGKQLYETPTWWIVLLLGLGTIYFMRSELFYFGY